MDKEIKQHNNLHGLGSKLAQILRKLQGGWAKALPGQVWWRISTALYKIDVNNWYIGTRVFFCELADNVNLFVKQKNLLLFPIFDTESLKHQGKLLVKARKNANIELEDIALSAGLPIEIFKMLEKGKNIFLTDYLAYQNALFACIQGSATTVQPIAENTTTATADTIHQTIEVQNNEGEVRLKIEAPTPEQTEFVNDKLTKLINLFVTQCGATAPTDATLEEAFVACWLQIEPTHDLLIKTYQGKTIVATCYNNNGLIEVSENNLIPSKPLAVKDFFINFMPHAQTYGFSIALAQNKQ